MHAPTVQQMTHVHQHNVVFNILVEREFKQKYVRLMLEELIYAKFGVVKK